MVEVAAIVLAAGRATRFAAGEGNSKVFAELEGRALVAHVVAAAAEHVGRVIVVTGQAAERAAAALSAFDVVLVHNARFAEGMSGSIAAGLAAVPRTAEAVMILLGDMPRVEAATLGLLVELFSRERPDAIVACHGGRRGNPVLLGRSLFPALLDLRGDEGARRILMDQRWRVLECPVNDPGVLVDVDTRDALEDLSESGADLAEGQAASRPADRPDSSGATSDELLTQASSEIRSSISLAGSGGAKK